jgi:hypothetical protein
LPFGRPPQTQHRGKNPATLDVVGCTCYWRRTRKGHWRLGCKTRRASLRRAQTSIDDGCRRYRHLSIEDQHAALNRRVRGHFNYFGVSGNYPSLMRLVEATKRAWYKWLRRRSQRTRLHWERCTEMLRWWPLPCPRITVRIWDGSPRATSAEEPDGGNLLVRIWRGAELGNRSAYSTKPFSPRPPGCTPPSAATLARGACRAPSAPRQPAGAVRSKVERGAAQLGRGLGRRRRLGEGRASGERPARPRILWGASPHAVHGPRRPASISDVRRGNTPPAARTEKPRLPSGHTAGGSTWVTNTPAGLNMRA